MSVGRLFEVAVPATHSARMPSKSLIDKMTQTLV